MSNYIKNLVATRGWKEIEELLNAEITNLRNSPIDEKMPANEYKIVDLANKKAAKTIQNIIRKIKLKGSDIKKDIKVYR